MASVAQKIRSCADISGIVKDLFPPNIEYTILIRPRARLAHMLEKHSRELQFKFIAEEQEEKLKEQTKGKPKPSKEPPAPVQSGIASAGYGIDLQDLQQRFSAFEQTMKQEVSMLKQEFSTLRQEVSTLRQEISVLQQENSALKSTVERHWRTISALNLRSLLDRARMNILGECPEFWELVRSAPKDITSITSLRMKLSAETQKTLSVDAIAMMFDVEHSLQHEKSRGNNTKPSIRQQGNIVAHALNRDNAVLAIQQKYLTKNRRTCLSEVFVYIYRVEPSFEFIED